MFAQTDFFHMEVAMIPEDDERVATQLARRFHVAQKVANQWQTVSPQLELRDAVERAIQKSATCSWQIAVFLDSATGGTFYWDSKDPDLFNSIVLTHPGENRTLYSTERVPTDDVTVASARQSKFEVRRLVEKHWQTVGAELDLETAMEFALRIADGARYPAAVHHLDVLYWTSERADVFHSEILTHPSVD
jgi:hypothetical protein